METKQAPKKACQFLASVDVRSNGESAKTAPVTITALSGEPINHWYWGNCIFDFDGMKLNKQRLALDYCHEEDEIIGYCGNFDASSGSLECSGALVPYAANPEDKATEIIYKAQQGVPWEASIYFTDPLIEQVPEGFAVTVNGRQFSGVDTVFREWTLRGIAICPYGQDSQTETMALTESNLTNIRIKEQGKMSEQAQPPVEQVEAAGVQDTQATEGAPVEVAEVVEEVATPEAAPVEATAMSEGKKFLTAFGTQGGVWFAEGKTFQEASELYLSSLKSENESLKVKLKDAETKLSANRGEDTPLSGGLLKDEKAASVTKLSQNLPSGLAKFAAGIKITPKN